MSGFCFLVMRTLWANDRGASLIELIMVMAILGVLAVVLLPRLNPQDFDARGFHDETLALLRYAQKTAVAQRRQVCVAFTAGSATLSQAAAEGNVPCTAPLPGPRGEVPGRVTARSGVSYQTVPGSDLVFDALGRPNAGLTLQVLAGATPLGRTITVEADTGYVHD